MEIAAANNGAMGIVGVFYIAIIALVLVGYWKTYTKAGQKGWTSIIPILNSVVMLKIVKRPLWWIILLLIPCVNIVVFIMVFNQLSKSFGKGVGFTVGLLLLPMIFFPVLGFGAATYQLEKDPLF